MEALHTTLIILTACITFSFFAGLITRNYSHVDRIWSLLPPACVLIWLPDYIHNPRYLVITILIVLWGTRLTWNFARKGGYDFSFKKGFTGEDYRWEFMRKIIKGRFLFELFNLFFISAYQLILVFVFTLPAWYIGKIEGKITPAEIILWSVCLLLFILETVADIQQFSYYKKRNSDEFKDDKRIQAGFNTFGLWRFSRHPNYVCEMGQWLVLYLLLFTVRGSHHWSGLGAVLLILLFSGSTVLAEYITKNKYPLYKMWQKAAAPWIPWIDLLWRQKARREFWREVNNSN